MKLAEAQALLDGMTPGPWAVFEYEAGKSDTPLRMVGDEGRKTFCAECIPEPNARAIASLPDILKALIAQIEDNERLKKALERIAGSYGPDMNTLHPDACAQLARATLKESNRHD